MALADGLRRRIDASMVAATTLSAAAAAYFIFIMNATSMAGCRSPASRFYLLRATRITAVRAHFR
jgi:hypothetical protein